MPTSQTSSSPSFLKAVSATFQEFTNNASASSKKLAAAVLISIAAFGLYSNNASDNVSPNFNLDTIETQAESAFTIHLANWVADRSVYDNTDSESRVMEKTHNNSGHYIYASSHDVDVDVFAPILKDELLNMQASVCEGASDSGSFCEMSKDELESQITPETIKSAIAEREGQVNRSIGLSKMNLG